MVNLHKKYEIQNISQVASETDPFTIERYQQFSRLLPNNARQLLDIGCNTGRGGLALNKLHPKLILFGLDCSQDRLDALPTCYHKGIYGLSTEIPTEDQSFDAIVAGEFLEHLYPADVDKTICEFQRILKIGGRLLLTTPNPGYLKTKIYRASVYHTVSHLTQHFPKILKSRLMMHGFSNVKLYGSGKVSRYLGARFPFKLVYGSYLLIADKY